MEKMMRKVLCCWLSLAMFLACSPVTALAFDESVPDSTQVQTESGAIAEDSAEAFAEEYISVKEGASAYSEPDKAADAGVFSEEAVVYSPASGEKDGWEKVIFFTSAENAVQGEWTELYVESKDCEQISVSEAAAMLVDPEIVPDGSRQFEGKVITLAKFEAPEAEENAAEEAVSPEAEADSEEAEAAEAAEETSEKESGSLNAKTATVTRSPANATTSSGQTVTFSVKASGTGLSYQWQARNDSSSEWKDTALNGNKTATLSFEPTMSFNGRQYRCVVSDSTGSRYVTSAATLTVVAAPKITANPSNAATSSGHNVKFKVGATGTGLSYQWQAKNSSSSDWANTGLNGNKTDTLSFEPTISFDGRQYRCIVTDEFGATVISNAATLTVDPAIVINSAPQDAAVSSGMTATFKVSATGTGLSYQWQTRNDSSSAWANTGLNGNKTATLSFEPTLSFDGRQYRCVVTDKYGATKNTAAATLTVDAAPRITSSPSNVAVSSGMTATFRVSAEGTGLKYQWQARNDSSSSWANTGLNGNKTATLSFEPTLSFDGRQYRCVVTDKYGASVTSRTVTLTVDAAPRITANPSNVTTSSGQTATFKVSAEGTGLKYQWQVRSSSSSAWENTGLDGNKTATLSFATTVSYSGRQYRCVITDKYGATDVSNAATLTVVSPIVINSAPKSVATSSGMPVSFTVSATGTGIKYQWQVRNDSSSEWTNTGLNGNKTDTLSFDATISYNGKQYRCVVTDKYGATKNTAAATLTVVSAPKITSNPSNVALSSGMTATFKVSATGTGIKYQWQARNNSSSAWENTGLNGNKTATLSFEPTMSFDGRQYRCVVTDKYGATVTSGYATLTVDEAPRIKVNPSSMTTSSGMTATFKVSAAGVGLKYQWQARNDSSSSWANTGLNGNKTDTLSFDATASYNGRQFRCIVTDKYGATVTSGYATLTVVSPPSITSNPSNVAVSSGMTATFRVSATGTGISYQWQARNDSSSAWANTGLNGNKTATLSFETTASYNGRQYRCIVTDKYGAKATSAYATLTVGEALRIKVDPSSVTTSTGRAATFKVSAAGVGLKYQWQFRSSSSGSWSNLSGATSASYSITPGSTSYSGYQYRVIVTDKYGASLTSDYATLTVVNGPTVTTPSSTATSSGLTVYFSVSATGTGISYQWQYREDSSSSWANTGLNGNKTATLSFEPTLSYNGRQYRCVVTDKYGATATSGAATLTVVAAPTVTNPSNVSVQTGNTATFRVTGTGASITYQWQYRTSSSGSWSNISGATSNSYSITPSSTSYNGYQYRCIVTDRYGATAISNAATLTVTQAVKYRALLIGNNYVGTDSELEGCVNDTKAMEGMLKSLKNTYTVTRKNEASASTILNSIPTAFSGATSNDVSLFYYSGHGVYDFDDGGSPTELTGALCGIDCDDYYYDPDGYDGYVTMKELAAKLNNVPGKIIVILDSCHSGAAIGKSTAKSAASEEELEKFNQSVIDAFSGYKLEKSGDGFSKFGELATSKFIVISAATYTRSSYDGSVGGQFTEYFLEGVGATYPNGTYSGSMPADTNSDSLITLLEAYTYARDNVKEECEYRGWTYPSPQYYGTGSYVLFRRK